MTEEELQATVAYPKTKEKTYTEHEAVIRYADGSEREIVFDAMNEEDHGITLKNYTGTTTDSWGHRTFTGEAFITLPYENFRNIETLNRVEQTMEYEEYVEMEVKDRTSLEELKEKYGGQLKIKELKEK